MSYFEAIDAPISEALPCGDNPDNDADYLGFLAAAEGSLPRSYIKFLERKPPEFNAAQVLGQITKYVDRYRDVRLLVLAAKYLILTGDLIGFSDALAAISRLIENRWDEAHPKGQDGDQSERLAQIGSLDDLPTVVLPLQTATILKDKRLGPISFRHYLLATRAAAPREGETAPDEAGIRDALSRTEEREAFKQACAAVQKAGDALKKLRAVYIDKAGYEFAPSFDKLAPLLADMHKYLGGLLSELEPLAAVPEPAPADEAPPVNEAESQGGAPAPSAFPPPLTLQDAAEALKAIAAYFSRLEPSNPALLLIRQAEHLVGKSFIEAMLVLAPSVAEKSQIKIGGDSPFALNYAQLKALAEQANPGQGDGNESAAPPNTYVVASRTDANRLMSLVEAYYRRSEPSSPIPLLIERARLFVDKDFSSLLRDMLKPA
jgi:type VI secretion system protein ImpA